MKNHDNFLGIYEKAFSQDFCEQLIEHIDLLEDRGIVIPSQNFKHKIDDNSINFAHFYNLKSNSLKINPAHDLYNINKVSCNLYSPYTFMLILNQ